VIGIAAAGLVTGQYPSHGRVGEGARRLRVADPVTFEGKTSVGTLLWEAQTQKFTVVALPGMPAVNGLTFLPTPVPGVLPHIND
jgi:hypothetical protein